MKRIYGVSDGILCNGYESTMYNADPVVDVVHVVTVYILCLQLHGVKPLGESSVRIKPYLLALRVTPTLE